MLKLLHSFNENKIIFKAKIYINLQYAFNKNISNLKKLEYFIKDIHPVEFFDKKNFDVVKIIKNNFPSVKIIIKGDRIVANGEEALIIQLRIRLDSLIMIMNNNDSINDKTINSIMSGKGEKLISSLRGKLILHGVGKKKIKAHTVNQIKIVDAFINNDMVFAIGPAGTGYFKSEGFDTIGFEESVWVRPAGGKYSEDIYVSAHVDDCLLSCKSPDVMSKSQSHMHNQISLRKCWR